MDFEWDEDKRERVLDIPGLDFLRARLLFDGRPLYSYPSPRPGEERWVSIGDLDGRLIAVIWCLRDERTRIVTMRRARREEERTYRSLYCG